MRFAAAGTGNFASAPAMSPSGSPCCSRRVRMRSRPVPDTTPSWPADETARASLQSETPAPMPPWMISGRAVGSKPPW